MWHETLKTILKTLNLLIFLYLIYYFIKKPLAEFLKNYKDEILKKREDARKKEIEAEILEKEAINLKEKLQGDLKEISLKFEELKKETKEEIEEETKRILSKIQKEYEDSLKEEEEKAKQEILNFIQEKVVLETENILNKTMDFEEQKKYLLKIIGGEI